MLRLRAVPRAAARRRARALERSGAASPEALAGHRRPDRGRHQRLRARSTSSTSRALTIEIVRLTGVQVWETVPDRVIADADEVELVDLPPDELLARLKAVGLPAGRGAQRRRPFFPSAEFDRASRARAASDDEPRRGRGEGVACARPDVARVARARAIARRDRPGRAGRAARARGQADGGRAQRGLERGLRRDSVAATAVRGESATAGSTCCGSPSRWRRDRHARRSDRRREGHRGTRRARKANARARRRAEAPRPARLLRRSTATELERRARGFDVVTIAEERGRRPARAGRAQATEPAAVHRGAARGRALRVGGDLHRALHGARVGDVPVLRALEPRDGLPARRDDRGPAVRARAVGARRGRKRRGLRLLLRAAALHVRRVRRAVRRHFRGDADRHARDREPDGERAPADPRRRRARAAHGARCTR